MTKDLYLLLVKAFNRRELCIISDALDAFNAPNYYDNISCDTLDDLKKCFSSAVGWQHISSKTDI
jgi:hypothetical protein